MSATISPAFKQFSSLFYNWGRIALVPVVGTLIYIWGTLDSLWIKLLGTISSFIPFSFAGWGIHAFAKFGWHHPFVIFGVSFIAWMLIIAPICMGICKSLAENRVKLPYLVLNGIFLIPLYGLIMNVLSAILMWKIWPDFSSPLGVFALISVFLQFTWIPSMQAAHDLNADDVWMGAFALPVSACGYALPVALFFAFTG